MTLKYGMEEGEGHGRSHPQHQDTEARGPQSGHGEAVVTCFNEKEACSVADDCSTATD